MQKAAASMPEEKEGEVEARTSFTAVALRASLLPLEKAPLCPQGHVLTAKFYSLTYHSNICHICGASSTDWTCSNCNYGLCSACRCLSLKSGAAESIAVPDDFVTLLVSALGAKGRSEGAENRVLEAKEARGILPAVVLWSCLQSLQQPRLCREGHPFEARSDPLFICANHCGAVGTRWRCTDCRYGLCSACHCLVPTAESVAVPVDFVNRVVSALGAKGCSGRQEDLVFESTNREALQHWLQHNLPAVCKLLAEALRNNKDLATEAVKRNGRALELCSETLRNDEDVAIEAIKRNGEALKYCSEELKNRKDIALEALRSCSAGEVYSLFEVLSKATQSNYEVALLALRISSVDECSKIFESLAEQLQDDETLKAIKALKSLNGSSAYNLFKQLSKEIQNTKVVAITALHRSGGWASEVVKVLSKELLNSKEVAMEAVKTSGDTIYCLSKTLRNDKDVAIEAFKRLKGIDADKLFRELSKEMQNNTEVAMAALKSLSKKDAYDRFKKLPKEMQNSKEVAMTALQRSRKYAEECFVELLTEGLQTDKEVALEAVKSYGKTLQHLSETLRNDKDVAIEAVKQCGDALQFCSEDLRGDKDVVMEAARNSATALKFALKKLNQDIDCLKAAGFLGASQAAIERRPEKGILSVKFGFSEKASDFSTVVAEQLANHPAMRAFEIYNPNLYCKKSCDPNFTDLNWGCRGTEATCTLEQEKKTTDAEGKPTKESCWRLSFSLHQEQCKETKGFMLQLEENGKLGAGQEIETLMANDLDRKIFRFQWKVYDRLLKAYQKRIVNQIADTVLDWFASEKRDTKMQMIEVNCFYTSKRFDENW